MKPYVYIIGDCNPIIGNIKKKFCNSFDVQYIKKENVNVLENDNVIKSTIFIILCCDKNSLDTDINIIKKLLNYQVICFLCEDIDRNEIFKLYNIGVIDIFNNPKDNLDTEIIIRKIESLLKIYTFKSKIDEDNTIFLHNTETYINILNSIDFTYLIINKDGNIINTSNDFKTIIIDENLINKKFNILINEQYIAVFDQIMHKLNKNEKVEEQEILLINNKWVQINCVYMGSISNKILIIIKDISNKKHKEYKQYIESQKRKDLIKQNIILIRKQLKEDNYVIN